ncbi:MAG: NAD(+)/NADH kinase [Deltaproteobacteria bacterium]|nr:NAD(+)/NADH kinase [Deltaproteobacteria bacterium]
MTPESKRDQIARAVVGAAASGAEHIVLVREPMRIAQSAVESMSIGAQLELIDIAARLDAGDTQRAVLAMRERGCGAIIVLGGDGTNRAIAQVWLDAPLVPISTGTNNVFPMMVEATLAGAAAGLVASAGRKGHPSGARRRRADPRLDRCSATRRRSGGQHDAGGARDDSRGRAGARRGGFGRDVSDRWLARTLRRGRRLRRAGALRAPRAGREITARSNLPGNFPNGAHRECATPCTRREVHDQGARCTGLRWRSRDHPGRR